MALLDKIIQVLPTAQKAAIRSLLARKKKLGFIRTNREEQIEAQLLYELIQGNLGNQIFNPRYVSSDQKISSKDHNSNMQEIFIDINALYQQVEALGRSDSQKTASLSSDYYKARAAVEKLINDARTYALRRKLNEFTEVQIIDFNSARNVANNYPKAVIDEKTRNLELRALTSTRAHLVNRGTRVTRVYTKTISPGIKGALATTFSPELMVDQKPETFWGTLVMTDAPVKQVYSDSSSKEIDVRGPVTHIYLKYNNIEPINVIRVLPFGEFPIDIIDVAYKPNISSEVYLPVKEFDTPATLDWLEINFKPVYASEIRITISQENAKLVNYRLPKKSVTNTDLFNYIFKLRANTISGAAEVESDFTIDIQSTLSAYEEAIQDLEAILNIADLEKTPITEIDLTEELVTALGLVLSSIDKEGAKHLIQTDIIQARDEEELVDIKKYEYVLGVREIETAYEQYAPYCYYKSEAYLPQATLADVQIEVDEEHIESSTSWGSYYSSSTEWEVDFGEGRILPIHPINSTGKYGVPATQDELLQFTRLNHVAHTRLGSKRDRPLVVKKNGTPMPLTGAYTAYRVTGSIPRIRVELSNSWFDENSIYTIDYEVSPDSYNIDVLDSLETRDLVTPEIYTELGPDKDLVLERYPFVDYNVINRTGIFNKYEDRAVWYYEAPTGNFTSGHIKVWPTITNSVGEVYITGSITGYTVTGVWGAQSGIGPQNLQSEINATYLESPFGYYAKIQDFTIPFEVSGAFTSTGIYFKDIPTLSLEALKQMPSGATRNMTITGDSPSGYLEAEFVLGVGVEINKNVYAFDNTEYAPVRILIGGKEAKNITDYETLEHPAFSVANTNDVEYQYIHAGRRVYFNQELGGQEISINYSWLTQYISINGILRCNKPIKLDTTPKVGEIRVLMNTTIL